MKIILLFILDSRISSKIIFKNLEDHFQCPLKQNKVETLKFSLFIRAHFCNLAVLKNKSYIKILNLIIILYKPYSIYYIYYSIIYKNYVSISQCLAFEMYHFQYQLLFRLPFYSISNFSGVQFNWAVVLSRF